MLEFCAIAGQKGGKGQGHSSTPLVGAATASEQSQEAQNTTDDGACTTQENAFQVAERVQQAREAMSGLLRSCKKQ
jgi:hypothetical protein